MKTYCKKVDIEDYELIKSAIVNCLAEKTTRRDVRRFCEKHISRSRRSDESIHDYYLDNIDDLVKYCKNKIHNKDFTFPPIYYHQNYDRNSEKMREIGVQNIEQQIFDYIAVYCLKPVFCRIGEFQCASIPGRGQSYAQKHIQRWMRDKNITYFVKLDIKKYYESIDKEELMKFLRRYVKNSALLEMVEALVYTFKNGLSIGSYLSQFLANLYLSQLYHSIAETYFKDRKSKRFNQVVRVRLIKHVLFYMDDILLLGTDKQNMREAVKRIIKEAAAMKLTIKDNWKITKIKDSFVPMVGLRFYKTHTTIKRKTFIRLRRAHITIKKRLCKRKPIPIIWFYRIIAYNGFLLHSNSYKFQRRYRTKQVFEYAKKVISNAARSGTLQYPTAVSENFA